MPDQKQDLLKEGKDKAQKWISNGLDHSAIIYAEAFGKQLSPAGYGPQKALTSSQIRNIYGEVIRIKMKGYDKVSALLLKPRLAYMTKRKGTDGSRDFNEVISVALDEVFKVNNEDEQRKRFENFANFFEAILAYHKAYGGK